MGFDFYPGGRYDEKIPTIDQILGYSVGERITTYHDLEKFLRRISEASDRVKLHTYGRTYEGRNLYYVVISSPENLANIDTIKENLSLLADPRKLESEGDLERIISQTPPITWIACNVHGGEHSSGESSILTIYQLAAGQDDATLRIIQDTVVIVDPVQNPDGRERSVNYFYSAFGIRPNPDPNAAEHSMPWIGGRTNHYLFDLNRDWFPLTQIESRAKVKAFLEWNPQVYADLHEMGHNSTYYFAPPRKPINGNVHQIIRDWWEVFGRANAAAFDKMGFEYYTRESFDFHYPGYGESWPAFHGAVGMTYEEASARGTVIEKEDKTTLTLRDAAQHHFTASMATCQTTAIHKEKILHDFYEFHRSAIEEGCEGKTKEFLIVPEEGSPDAARFVEKLTCQGIEVRIAEEGFCNSRARNYSNNRLTREELPAGTYIIRLDQPKKRLIQAIFEMEAELSDEFIREQIQRKKDRLSPRIYDITAWSLPLAYGLRTYWTEEFSQVAIKPFEKTSTAGTISTRAKSAYLLRYNSNAAIKIAFSMLQHGYTIHVAKEPFAIKLASSDSFARYDRGTLVFKVNKNQPAMHDMIMKLAGSEGVQVYSVDTQWVEEGINLGSDNVVYVKKPRIAVLYEPPANQDSYGWLAYLMEQVYGIEFTALRHSSIMSNRIISDYNVIILPNGPSGDYNRLIGISGAKTLKNWVSMGGTLIMIKGAAAFATKKDVELSSSRLVTDLRWKKGGQNAKTGSEAKTGSGAGQQEVPREFRPSHVPGAVLRTKLDQTHFLSFGYGRYASVLMNSSLVFAPSKNGINVATYADQEELRVSGVVWKEMLDALPGNVYLTDERVGHGHIILYADDPNFRGYWNGLSRLFFNAVLFGPSLSR